VERNFFDLPWVERKNISVFVKIEKKRPDPLFGSQLAARAPQHPHTTRDPPMN
jgi:hypothetical protein